MGYRFLMLTLTAVAAGAIGCEQMRTQQAPQGSTEFKADASPATDDEPLLLLDDDPEFEETTGVLADNSRCHVCHMNYLKEDIAVIHARVGIDCVKCHGDCDAHIADESWAWGGNGTPPGVMYPRPTINPFCMGCHPKDTIYTEQHEPLFAADTQKKYCTDCHGDHRLTNRQCKWK